MAKLAGKSHSIVFRSDISHPARQAHHGLVLPSTHLPLHIHSDQIFNPISARSRGLAANLRQAKKRTSTPRPPFHENATSAPLAAATLAPLRSSLGTMERSEKKQEVVTEIRALRKSSFRYRQSMPGTFADHYMLSAGLRARLFRRCFRGGRRDLGICWTGWQR